MQLERKIKELEEGVEGSHRIWGILNFRFEIGFTYSFVCVFENTVFDMVFILFLDSLIKFNNNKKE